MSQNNVCYIWLVLELSCASGKLLKGMYLTLYEWLTLTTKQYMLWSALYTVLEGGIN